MLITKTTPTPISYSPDSFTVEIELMIGDAEAFTNLTMGPFKRLEHWDHLEDLLKTLERVAAENSSDSYESVLGFRPWFSERASESEESLQEFEEECLEWAFDEEEEIIKKVIALSFTFAQNWGREPGTSGEYPQSYHAHKVFYHDNNGLKFDTTVQLDAS